MSSTMDTNTQFQQNIEDFNAQHKEEFNKVLEEKGFKGLVDYAWNKIQAWKSVKVNIAVIGPSGVGKSSFINAIRGLNGDSDGAAPVGVTQTTMKAQAYKHPKNDNILLWDLPGFGTKEFKREEYIKKMDIGKYDFFLVLGKDRFTENDKWILQMVKSFKKRGYFVRTNVGQNIQNEKDDYPKTFNEQHCLKKIKDECMLNLKDMANVQLFLIDNKKTHSYDFDKLTAALLNDGPQVAMEVLVNAIESTGEESLNAKTKILKARAYNVAIGAAAVGALPVVNAFSDHLFIKSEFRHYKECFGLDDSSLEAYANRLSMSKSHLLSEVKLTIENIKSSDDILKLGDYNDVTYVFKSFISAIPLVGTITSGIITYPMVLNALQKLVDVVCNDAIKLNSYVADKICKK